MKMTKSYGLRQAASVPGWLGFLQTYAISRVSGLREGGHLVIPRRGKLDEVQKHMVLEGILMMAKNLNGTDSWIAGAISVDSVRENKFAYPDVEITFIRGDCVYTVIRQVEEGKITFKTKRKRYEALGDTRSVAIWDNEIGSEVDAIAWDILREAYVNVQVMPDRKKKH